MSLGAPPLWSVFAVQAVSVLGDQFGQRASRKDYEGSSRRMLIALTMISGLQILLVLGILQLTLPVSITGAIYSQGDTLSCYKEVDDDGHLPGYCDSHNCTLIACPSQGPGSMFHSIGLHPLLLLNGVQNIAYYIGEVLLYHHPLGLVFIVIASLSASFIIDPLQVAMGLDSSAPVPPAVIILGVLGAILCVLERKASAEQSIRQHWQQAWRRLQYCWRRGCRGCYTSPEQHDALITKHKDTPEPNSTSDVNVREKHSPPAGNFTSTESESSAALTQSDDDLYDTTLTHASSRPFGTVARHHTSMGELDSPLGENITTVGVSTPTPYASAPAAFVFPVTATTAESDVNTTYQPVVVDPVATVLDLDPRHHRSSVLEHFWGTIRILIPFLLLSITYGLWFVTQKLFNDDYRCNLFGYTSIDQVLAPVYMWTFLCMVDLVPPFKRAIHSGDDVKESFCQAVVASFRTLKARNGRAFFTIFLYRFLINARAIAYFYIGVTYDLSTAYLELTLVRVILSWIVALIICALSPRFIGLTTEERVTVFAPLNVVMKVIGTGFILAAVFILNASQN